MDDLNAKLLPCPCCGSPAKMETGSAWDYKETWIKCTKCRLRTSGMRWLGSSDHVTDALIHAWNQRAELSAKDAQIAALSKEQKEML